MKDIILKAAEECKRFSDQNIKYYKQLQNNRIVIFVIGANKYFENLLLSLCRTIENKYPYITAKLREHISQYDLTPVVHQSAIDEFVNYIIDSETRNDLGRKIFISHSSEDKQIVAEFIEKILRLGCGFHRSDIFCTLDHTAIRTGNDFRKEIIDNMKSCDYIICMISDNYRNSEVCQNEMGAAWALDDKRVLPFKFPNIKFTEIGFLNVIKQAADITDGSKLDELYDDLCVNYGFPQDWVNFNKQKEDFVNFVRLR